MESYEQRNEQLLMAQKIEDVLSKSGHLLIEAGTGTGKSMAYLIPTILHGARNKKRVIISTYTKILQSQLVEKDIPFVKQMLQKDNIKFEYAVFFGGENYLCMRKCDRYISNLLIQSPIVEKFIKWANKTPTGVLNEFEFDEEWHLRAEVSREFDICLGKKCAFRGRCFWEKALKKAFSSDVLVINHHLFFANISSGGKILPNFDIAVCDEAHNLEEVAMELLGLQISNFQIKKLLDDIYSPKYKRGLLYKVKKTPKHLKNDVLENVHILKASSDEFFAELSAGMKDGKDTMRFRTPPSLNKNIINDLKALSVSISRLIDSASSDEEMAEIKSKAQRASVFSASVDSWLNHKTDDSVYWLEKDILKRGHRFTLCITPIDVSGIISKKFFDVVDTAILTSATMSVDKNFNYIEKSLGVRDAEHIILESSFDYKKNVILYAPVDIPDPKMETELFSFRVKQEIETIIGLTSGRAFVLFTSYKMLNFVHLELEYLKAHNFFKQGAYSQYHIIEKFKTSENAVLFGTDSFWQGVDIPGDALICVIITRLPFGVPDHPVVEAKIEKIVADGKDAFSEYTLPRAILKFRQGCGRLMRSQSDWGVIAVLDSRIHSRYYGKYFLNSVPPTTVTGDLEAVKQFIAKRSGAV